MTTVAQIIASINAAELSLDDLNKINAALRGYHNRSRQTAAVKWRAGQEVEFTHSKTGVIYRGTIEKVNSVSVHVRAKMAHIAGAPELKWKVSPTALRVVA